MTKALNKLERKIGRFAIPRLTVILVLLQGVGHIIYATNPSWLNSLSMNPYAILHGQVWRLATWLIIPYSIGNNIFFTLLLLLIFFNFGTHLERAMGDFRYNLYIFAGMIFTAIGAFIVLIYFYLFRFEWVSTPAYAEMLFTELGLIFSTFYVYMSIFLALAVYIPDMTLMLMFILPVKMKYLAMVYGFILFLTLIRSDGYGRIVIVTSMLNFLILFIGSRDIKRYAPKELARRAAFVRDVKKGQQSSNQTRKNKHKCAVCGVTDAEAPEREFRYCSKCEGSYEYCDQHLYTHAHVQGGGYEKSV